MNRIDLVDCKAIVTGGSGGLGQAIMARLQRSGAAVANFDRRQGGALAEAELFCACDVTDAAAVDAAVGRAVDAFGRIDILVKTPASPLRRSRSPRPRSRPGGGCSTST